MIPTARRNHASPGSEQDSPGFDSSGGSLESAAWLARIKNLVPGSFNSAKPGSDTKIVGKSCLLALFLLFPAVALQADCPAYFNGRGNLELKGNWKLYKGPLSGGQSPS